MANIIKSIKRFISRSKQQSNPDNRVSEVIPAKKEPPLNQVVPRELNQAPFREIKTNYLAFDLEIATPVPGDFNNWQNYRPLGISCAATMCDGEAPRLWFSKNTDGSIAPKLSEVDSYQLALYLFRAVHNGWTIVTWNGLGFDFQILAEEGDEWSICSKLALGHIDMMFHLFCLKGYPIALNKAAQGMKLPGKLEGMTGEFAPILWQQGQYEKVFRYVEQDVRTTLDVAKAGLYHKKISWTSNNGTYQAVDLPNGWMRVEEVTLLSMPDTSWMRNPINRSDFFQWILDYNSAMEEAEEQMEQESDISDEELMRLPIIEETNNPTKEIELSEDEINRQFAQCDQGWETGPIPQTKTTKGVQKATSFVMVCPCPICRGAPNLDSRFKQYYEEDNVYSNRYDDDY